MDNIREKVKLVVELLLVLPVIAVGGWLWNRTGGLADTITTSSNTTSYNGTNLDGTFATVSAYKPLQDAVIQWLFWLVAIAVVGFIIYKLVKHKEGE